MVFVVIYQIDKSRFFMYNTAMKILIVPEKYNNKKLINYLQDTYHSLSSSTIYKTLRKKDIRINDKRISDNCLLKTGDEIKVYIADVYKNLETQVLSQLLKQK